MSNSSKNATKRLVALFLAVTLLLCCGCSKDNSFNKDNLSSEENNSQNISNTTNVDSQKENNNKIPNASRLSIPYTVEDYVENAIVVSKNDGLLYGVLNNKGEVILPVKYDKIEIMDKTQYIKGANEEVFINTYLEGTTTIFDLQGHEILTSQSINGIEMVKLAIPEKFSSETPVFCEKDYINGWYKLYNKDGEHLHTLNSIGAFICVNSDYYVHQTLGKISLYSYDGSIITSLPERLQLSDYNGAKNGKWSVILTDKQTSEAFIYTFDELGNKFDEKKIENGIDDFSSFQSEYDDRSYKIYKSNSTWKLEDLKGNPLYLDRYYKNLWIDGGNDCHLLTNEDNGICVVGSRGNMYIDFGELQYTTESIYSINDNKKVKTLHEGKDSVILVFGSGDNSEIKFYN